MISIALEYTCYIPISNYVSKFLSNRKDSKNNLFTMILTEQESKLLKIIRKNNFRLTK